MEKNVIEALVECDFDKLISVFTGRYFGTIRGFVFGEGRSVPDKAISILKERIESTLDSLEAIAYDPYTNGYYQVVGRVGDAFKDGMKLK